MLNKGLANPTPVLNCPLLVSFPPLSLYRGFAASH